ncbi:hypothetical protein NW817_11395, partial [Synechococcus sp. H65.1]
TSGMRTTSRWIWRRWKWRRLFVAKTYPAQLTSTPLAPARGFFAAAVVLFPCDLLKLKLGHCLWG